MASLVYKAEVTEQEFLKYKTEKIDTRNFSMSKNLVGDMFFIENNGSGAIFVYKWEGGYLIQETE